MTKDYLEMELLGPSFSWSGSVMRNQKNQGRERMTMNRKQFLLIIAEPFAHTYPTRNSRWEQSFFGNSFTGEIF